MSAFHQRMQTPEVQRILRFLAVGFLNTVFGYVVFAALFAAGVGAQIALICSFVIGILWNYQTHARLVFASSGSRRLPAYIAVYVALYGLNAVVLAGLIWLGLSAWLAQALFLPVSAILAYLGIGRVLTGRFPWEAAIQRVPNHQDQA